MAVTEAGLAIGIAGTFGSEVAQHVSADLYPLSVPTYDDLVESHRRWMARETIAPTALHIGEIILDPDMTAALTVAASSGEYRLFHSDDRYVVNPIPDDVDFGGTNATEMFHRLVGMISEADASRRGVDKYYTEGHETYGGMLLEHDGTMDRHVDYAHGSDVTLRYIATVGDPTGFTTDPVSKDDIGRHCSLIEGRADKHLLAYPDGVVAVTLFTMTSPHYRSTKLGVPRLSSTLNVVKKDTLSGPGGYRATNPY